jgi:hypothetical protein
MKGLAPSAQNKLLKSLEEFVNMGDQLSDLKHFRKRWPDFVTKADYDWAERDCRQESRSPWLMERKQWLRELWKGGPLQDEHAHRLAMMLGIESDSRSYSHSTIGIPTGLGSTFSEGGMELEPLRAAYLPRWTTGEFDYSPRNDFQRALYLLFKNSWRAKICPQCDSYFVANKVSQRYCSTDCSDKVQSELRLRWWRQHGKQWREQRKRAERHRRK